MRRIFVIASLAGAMLVPTSALATPPDYSQPGVGPGSLSFHPSQCVWNGSVLRCTRTYDVIVTSTFQEHVLDETCESGIRIFEVTQTERETYFQFIAYEGRVPLEQYSIAGDESLVDVEVLSVDSRTDLGCL
jgi:hypothetical protein